MNDDQGMFEELTDELDAPQVVIFLQQTDEVGPAYELVGDVDLDEAITVALKGLVSMVLDSLGFWDIDEDDEDDEDDEEPESQS